MSEKTITKVYDEILVVKSLLEDKTAEYINIDQACAYLGFKKGYLYNLIWQKKIPYYKPNGKKLYFNRRELAEWISKGRNKTVDEVKEEHEKKHKSLLFH